MADSARATVKELLGDFLCPKGHDNSFLQWEPKWNKWYCVECNRYYPDSSLKARQDPNHQPTPSMEGQATRAATATTGQCGNHPADENVAEAGSGDSGYCRPERPDPTLVRAETTQSHGIVSQGPRHALDRPVGSSLYKCARFGCTFEPTNDRNKFRDHIFLTGHDKVESS